MPRPIKMIEFGDAARAKILIGVNVVAKAVGATLGPKGRNMILEREFTEPRITKDGVTVAREIFLEDKFEDMGARILRQIASKTNDLAGDGTSTSTVLGAAIYREGVKAVAAGMNPMDLKRGIDLAVTKVVAEIKKMARPVKDNAQVAQIGTISANGDVEVGQKLAEALKRVGKDGVITVEEGKGVDFELEVVEGMLFETGFVSPYFVTNAEKMKVEFENPYILICDVKIANIQELVPLLEAVVHAQRPLLIIAEDVDPEALNTLVMNKVRNGIKVAVVKAPGFGHNRKDILRDIAILTGGEVVSEDLGVKLENWSVKKLGRAKKIIAERNTTVIIGGEGKKRLILQRCTQIRNQVPKAASRYEKDLFKERLAKMSSGVAIIRVGGTTDIEVKERRDRVDDALNATRAAVEEGIVAGGGVTLLYAAQALKNIKNSNQDQLAGVNIVRRALESPIRQIAENAGIDGAVVVGDILRANTAFYTYNAQTGEYGDAFAMGVIDPAKVSKIAVQNAASVAGLLLTTEGIIVDKPQDEVLTKNKE